MKSIIKRIFLFFFCLILLISTFELCIRGYKKWLAYSYQQAYQSEDDSEVVVLALGESTTAPITNDAGEDYSWPRYLEYFLNNKTELDVSFRVINQGQDGTRSTYILQDLEEDLEKYQPDLVVSMIGINDLLEVTDGNDDYVLALALNQEEGLAEYLYSYRWLRFIIQKTSTQFSNLVTHEDEALPLTCTSETDCLELASEKSRQNNRDEAQLLFLKALEYNRDNDRALREVIFYYLEKQQPEEAEKYVEDLVRNHHNIPDNLFILGYAMRFLEKYGQAESYFKQAIEQDPQYSRAYAGLIYILALSPRIESDRERFAEIVENVLENQVNSVEVLTALAERSQAYEYDKELFYRENLNISSSDTYGQLAAARYYVRYQKWEKAKNYYLLALKDPDISSSILIELYELYHNLGEDKALEQVLADVLKAEDNYIQNYQRLQLRLKAQKIPLIAVQYPMRSTRPLEHIFQDKSDVWLVDNEDSFQQIVATEGFERVFIDSFAGDFGHCNEFGNQLLATNIMKVIINNWQDLGLTSR